MDALPKSTKSWGGGRDRPNGEISSPCHQACVLLVHFQKVPSIHEKYIQTSRSFQKIIKV